MILCMPPATSNMRDDEERTEESPGQSSQDSEGDELCDKNALELQWETYDPSDDYVVSPSSRFGSLERGSQHRHASSRKHEQWKWNSVFFSIQSGVVKKPTRQRAKKEWANLIDRFTLRSSSSSPSPSPSPSPSLPPSPSPFGAGVSSAAFSAFGLGPSQTDTTNNDPTPTNPSMTVIQPSPDSFCSSSSSPSCTQSPLTTPLKQRRRTTEIFPSSGRLSSSSTSSTLSFTSSAGSFLSSSLASSGARRGRSEPLIQRATHEPSTLAIFPLQTAETLLQGANELGTTGIGGSIVGLGTTMATTSTFVSSIAASTSVQENALASFRPFTQQTYSFLMTSTILPCVESGQSLSTTNCSALLSSSSSFSSFSIAPSFSFRIPFLQPSEASRALRFGSTSTTTCGSLYSPNVSLFAPSDL